MSLRLMVLSVLVLATPLPVWAEDRLAAMPSYQESLEQFQAERAKKPSSFTSEDRAVMQRAGEELARAMPDPGLPVGARAPDFTLPNAFGQPVTLSEMLKQGPVVLTFYRGGWCPYCNLQLRGLHQSRPHFQRYGARLVAITPQRPDKSLEQVEKDGYPFEVLSDLDSAVMKAYGLYFEVPPELDQVYRRNGLSLAEYNGEGRLVLPVPGTYVIDRDGTIRAAFADTDYRKRVEPKAIVAALERL